jgi:hypothetical protein
VTVESTTEVPRDRSFAAAPAFAASTPMQRLALLALFAYLVSPLAIQAWLGGWPSVGDKLFVFSAVTSLLWLALAYVAAQRPAMMHLLLLPLYVTTAVDLFLLANFGARLSSGYVTILITDKSDMNEFLAAYGLPVALVTAVDLRAKPPCDARLPQTCLAALGGGCGWPVARDLWTGIWPWHFSGLRVAYRRP